MVLKTLEHLAAYLKKEYPRADQRELLAGVQQMWDIGPESLPDDQAIEEKRYGVGMHIANSSRRRAKIKHAMEHPEEIEVLKDVHNLEELTRFYEAATYMNPDLAKHKQLIDEMNRIVGWKTRPLKTNEDNLSVSSDELFAELSDGSIKGTRRLF